MCHTCTCWLFVNISMYVSLWLTTAANFLIQIKLGTVKGHLLLYEWNNLDCLVTIKKHRNSKTITMFLESSYSLLQVSNLEIWLELQRMSSSPPWWLLWQSSCIIWAAISFGSYKCLWVQVSLINLVARLLQYDLYTFNSTVARKIWIVISCISSGLNGGFR